VSDYADALAVRRPAGAILIDGAQVADTAQCVHCNGHFVMVKGSGTIRGFCRNCNGIVCGPGCAACVPFEKRLDLAERGGR
jgi:hypothetical protein